MVRFSRAQKLNWKNHLAWCHNCYVVCDTTKKTIEIYRDSQLYELARRPSHPPSLRDHGEVPAA
jgi:hypothetical protein